MSPCPECGDKVPFGGGRTVRNAHSMFEMARALSRQIKPGEEGQGARDFVDRGNALAHDLHAYGHKQSMVNPDWQAAGLWMRGASALAREFGVPV
jgi:hypothetical protein